MASKYWLKLYHEMLDDPKVARLNDSAYRRFIECLLMAGELDENGLLPPLEDMAWRIRVSETALAQDMTRLALGGMVELQEHEGEERWLVSQFAKRQSPMDKAEYMRRKREGDKKQKYYQDRYQPVTNGNTDIDIDIDTEEKRIDVYVDSAHAENTTPHEAMSAIACVVKETLAPGYNESDFENAAHAIIALDSTDKIPGFTEWWKRNSYYSDNGKPALRSFMDEFQNYLDGVEREQGNGKEKLTRMQIVARELEAQSNVD